MGYPSRSRCRCRISSSWCTSGVPTLDGCRCTCSTPISKENRPLGRWATARLYDGSPAIRLAQYIVLGIGGIRALRAMGIEPGLYHLNEGHAAWGALDVQHFLVQGGKSADEAWQDVRQRFVFTTHTPVQAGNETYQRDEILQMAAGLAPLADGEERLLALGRMNPSDSNEPSGLTALAIRASRSVNGVSARHGEVARAMWRPMFPSHSVDEVPITHVTNGVHIPTWMREPMRQLLDRHLGAGWLGRADDPETWAPVELIPDEEVWATRRELRRLMIEELRDRITLDRLRRGDPIGLATAAERVLDPDCLTLGYARRIASYKRLHLLYHDPRRARALMRREPAIQILAAGKAHPKDEEAKQIVRTMFEIALPRPGPAYQTLGGRGAFLEDYDMALAFSLVSGCDVWINLPRPPLEASGTSGMKAAMNGGLNLSVLDGWWCEAYDGSNGWAIDGAIDYDEAAQDARDAPALFDLLEQQVIPMFNERDRARHPDPVGAAREAQLGDRRTEVLGDADGSRLRHQDLPRECPSSEHVARPVLAER